MGRWTDANEELQRQLADGVPIEQVEQNAGAMLDALLADDDEG